MPVSLLHAMIQMSLIISIILLRIMMSSEVKLTEQALSVFNYILRLSFALYIV